MEGKETEIGSDRSLEDFDSERQGTLWEAEGEEG